jgi:hypothetical protein
MYNDFKGIGFLRKEPFFFPISDHLGFVGELFSLNNFAFQSREFLKKNFSSCYFRIQQIKDR